MAGNDTGTPARLALCHIRRIPDFLTCGEAGAVWSMHGTWSGAAALPPPSAPQSTHPTHSSSSSVSVNVDVYRRYTDLKLTKEGD